MKIFFLSFSACLLFATLVSGQSDSADSNIDTIYIKGDPVIIKSAYYLQTPALVDSGKWTIGAGLYIGKNLAIQNEGSININSASVFNYFVEAGRVLNRWTLTAGLGYLSTGGIVQRHSKINYEEETHLSILDTIDTYDQIVQGVKTRYYITEQKDTIITSQYVKDIIQKNSYKLNYLQIPFCLKFTLRNLKWYVSPGIGIVPSIALHKNYLIANDDELRQRKFLLLGSFIVEAGSKVTNFMRLGFVVQYSRNISPVLKESKVTNMGLFTGGIKIDFYF